MAMGLLARCSVGSSQIPRIEPMSPALAGRFFTTEPPGKPVFSEAFPDSYILCAPLHPKHSSMSAPSTLLNIYVLKTFIYLAVLCLTCGTQDL